MVSTVLGEVISKGLHSARTAASIPGRLYYETDTAALFRDNGSSWDQVAANATPLVCGIAKITGATTNASTSSWVDITGSSVTLTTGAHRLRLTLQGFLWNDTINDYAELTFSVDGTDIESGPSDGLYVMMATVASGEQQVASFVYLTPVLSAGSHTIKGRIKSAVGGTSHFAPNAGNPGFLYVEETPFTA
jgi:hypothetical protein